MCQADLTTDAGRPYVLLQKARIQAPTAASARTARLLISVAPEKNWQKIVSFHGMKSLDAPASIARFQSRRRQTLDRQDGRIHGWRPTEHVPRRFVARSTRPLPAWTLAHRIALYRGRPHAPCRASRTLRSPREIWLAAEGFCTWCMVGYRHFPHPLAVSTSARNQSSGRLRR